MKTIEEMARQADPKANLSEPYCLDDETRAWLEAFAKLVAAAEREACVKVCEEVMFRPSKNPDEAELAGIRLGSRFCAAAIRARENK